MAALNTALFAHFARLSLFADLDFGCSRLDEMELHGTTLAAVNTTLFARQRRGTKREKLPKLYVGARAQRRGDKKGRSS